MAGFDESAGLLGAAAGVVLVHQTALAVHEAVQIPAGACQALAEVAGAHLQHLAADRVAGAEDRAEGKDQSLLAVQAEQHAHRAAVLGLLDQQRQCHRHGFRIGQVEIRRAINGGPVIGEGRHPALRAAPLHVEDVVDGDAVEPGAEAALPLERAEPGDDLDQHLLGDLLGVVRVEHHADCDVVDPRLVSKDQALQRGTVAALGLFDQRGVRGVALGDLAKGVEHGSALCLETWSFYPHGTTPTLLDTWAWAPVTTPEGILGASRACQLMSRPRPAEPTPSLGDAYGCPEAAAGGQRPPDCRSGALDYDRPGSA